MDGFVSAFHQVDVDDDGIISEADLERYCIDNNLKKNFTQKWLKLFDHDNDGIIHYPEFCKALGIAQKRRYSGSSVKDDVEVFKETDMSNSTQDAVIQKIYRRGKPTYNLDQKTINSLIDDLNMDHGTKWDLVVNPTPKQVKCEYDFDGKLYYRPTVKSDKRILVWRVDEDKKKGICMCCC